jgi:hypothetical protein
MQHRDFPYEKINIPTDCQSSVLSEPTNGSTPLCVGGAKLKKRAVLDIEKWNAGLRRRRLVRIAKKILALSRGPATPEKAERFFRSYVRLNRYMNHQLIFQGGFSGTRS